MTLNNHSARFGDLVVLLPENVHLDYIIELCLSFLGAFEGRTELGHNCTCFHAYVTFLCAINTPESSLVLKLRREAHSPDMGKSLATLTLVSHYTCYLLKVVTDIGIVRILRTKQIINHPKE